jgi:chemotaxis signal transduction protein
MGMRATLAARPDEADRMVAFGLGTSRFAVPGTQIAEIRQIEAVTAVPAEDPTLLGVVVYGDEVVAVVDLGCRLGARAQGPGAPPWLCVVAHTGLGTMAFPIDGLLAFASTSGARLPDDVEILDLERA